MSRRVTLNDERIAKIVGAPNEILNEFRLAILRGEVLPSLTHASCIDLDDEFKALSERMTDAISIAILDLIGPELAEQDEVDDGSV